MTHKTNRRTLLQTAAAGGLLLTGAGGLLPARAADARQDALSPVKFKLGLASYSLRKFSLEETLAMTKRVGLEYICLKSFHLPLESTPEQIQQAAQTVAQAGIKLYGGGVITMRKPEEVDHAFEYAKTAGMTTIVGVPAPELLPMVNEKVQQYNICVAIHNHGPGDQLYPTPDVAYERIKNLDRRIGLCIDIGHTVRAGVDLVGSTRQCADRLLDVHIKDVSEASARGQCVEMGRGVIDVPAFLRMLIELGYARVVSFEYEKDPDDPLAGLAESVGYVRGVLAAIG